MSKCTNRPNPSDPDPKGPTVGWIEAEAENAPVATNRRASVLLILELGVLIVLAAGNDAKVSINGKKREDIDAIPQVLEKDTFPIINVGVASLDGKVMDFSQGKGTGKGTHLTIYGVGDKVDVYDHNDGKGTTSSGTSIAAPAVAGIVAVYST
jgi:hypothetical protein